MFGVCTLMEQVPRIIESLAAYSIVEVFVALKMSLPPSVPTCRTSQSDLQKVRSPSCSSLFLSSSPSSSSPSSPSSLRLLRRHRHTLPPLCSSISSPFDGHRASGPLPHSATHAGLISDHWPRTTSPQWSRRTRERASAILRGGRAASSCQFYSASPVSGKGRHLASAG
ncbi:hypothetical protein BU26DRAFT_298445 [Trematosphaeria pertusa]|uniref:Uncharacterized protein n=1 Tax=Trematosphaeria pertusa TaxID=390896 RepID=A0A6A6IL42_9PLEO|nr:uncharacterized protein BU26DRAFT_298445 [Trematosphaeria pertusa]KAF2250260.1 hypothetical protein BU26DRAFT_298445 [Trematosphaeria pertusa]